jgi:hypothetical protein
MAKYISVQVNYDPDKIDSDIVRNSFDGHDGGGYCFIDGMRDEFFIIEGYVAKTYLPSLKRDVRNMRRRKGVNGVSWDIVDDSDLHEDEPSSRNSK